MKNLDSVIRKTAADMGLPEDQVKVLVMKYWKDVYMKMVKKMPEDKTTIFLKHIGLFTISKFKLYKYINKKIRSIRYYKVSDRFSKEKTEIILKKFKEKLAYSLIFRNLVAKSFSEKQKQHELYKEDRRLFKNN